VNINTEQRGSVHCIHLEGELTIYAAAAVKAGLLDVLAGAVEIEIDLTGVTAIDTAGVQLLIAAKREAAADGVPLRLVGHSAAALELIELYELAGWFGDPLVLPPASATQQGAAA
jgi:anti-anti-sigma factor